jgi:hypothetical protein
VSKSSGQPAFVVLVRVGVRIDRSWESEGKTDPRMLGSYRKGAYVSSQGSSLRKHALHLVRYERTQREHYQRRKVRRSTGMGPTMVWNKMWGVRQDHWANEQSVRGNYARRHLIALSLEWQLGKYAARSRG